MTTEDKLKVIRTWNQQFNVKGAVIGKMGSVYGIFIRENQRHFTVRYKEYDHMISAAYHSTMDYVWKVVNDL